MIRVIGYTVYNGSSKSYKIDLVFTKHGLKRFRENLKYAYSGARVYLTKTMNIDGANWYKSRVSNKDVSAVSKIKIGGLNL